MQTIEQQLQNKSRVRGKTVTGIADVECNKDVDDDYSGFSSRKRTNTKNFNIEDDDENAYDGIGRKENGRKYENEFYTSYQGETLLDCEINKKGNEDYYSDYQSCLAVGSEQYFADNDQMLGSESLFHYKSNILLQKTEEEDLNELEELVIKLNKMFKNEIDESKIDDYTEILCRYFKANIQYSVMRSPDDDLLDSNLPIHQIMGNGYTESKGGINLGCAKPKFALDLRRSLSFNCLTEFNLKSFVSSVITVSQKKSKAEITNSHTYNETEGSGVLKDNIQEIITENLEADELIKVILIGDKASRTKFLKALKSEDLTSIEDTQQVEAETSGT